MRNAVVLTPMTYSAVLSPATSVFHGVKPMHRSRSLRVLISFVALSGVSSGCQEPLACGDLVEDPVRRLCVCPNGGIYRDGLCYLDGSVEPLEGMGDASAEERPDGGPDAAVEGSDAGLDACTERTFYRDADGDGFGDPASPIRACEAPAGFVENDTDCDDACVACRPGGVEVCEGSRDEDCAGGVDDGCACTRGAERACPGGSSMGVCRPGTQTCGPEGTWSACSGAFGPSAETCNMLDDDCDGVIDGPAAAVSCGSVSRATSVACSSGACLVTSCTSGWANCDSQFANGCEADLTSTAHCGSCGNACGWACAGAECNDAVAVESGDRLSCAPRTDGRVVCWGDRRLAPWVVEGISNATAVAVGGHHACALSGGTVRCWGEDDAGQLGGSSVSQPVPGLTNIVQIAAGSYHTCARSSSGGVWCWGANNRGQLGHTAAGVSSVTGINTAVGIGVGHEHTCAVLADGTIRCWGTNRRGQLGNGTSGSAYQVSPVVVGVVTGAVEVTGGGEHSCARTGSGVVYCWGGNISGELGDGTNAARTAPVLAMVSGVAHVDAGFAHTCATLTSGAIQCWGRGTSGELGNDSTTNTSMPVAVSGISNASRTSAGSFHSCAILRSGGLRCWGLNVDAQLGDGSTDRRLTPVPVLAP